MPMLSVVVTGFVCLAFIAFASTLAWADKQSRIAAARRARSVEKADNGNTLSLAA